MTPLKKNIPLFCTILFASLLMVKFTYSKPITSAIDCQFTDTTNIVVRICQGDMPGQKNQVGGDYIPEVCAYRYDKEELTTYKVVGFDLVYKDVNGGTQEVVSGKGNRFTIQMKVLFNKV